CSAVPARPPSPTPFPYTTLFRSADVPQRDVDRAHHLARRPTAAHVGERPEDRVPEVLDAGRVRPGDEVVDLPHHVRDRAVRAGRSEEHTSELQSRENLVCRLLLE